MKISDNKVVVFHYSLFNEAGEPLESSRDAEPTAYLHGADNIIRGLEQAMAGREAGEQFEVEVPPQDAYGLRNVERVQRVPAKHLLFKGRLRPGMVVQLNTEQGRRPVTVVKAGRHSAEVDTNHPLAGQALKFEVDIVEVRDATAEEVAHRHAHGPGGHHH